MAEPNTTALTVDPEDRGWLAAILAEAIGGMDDHACYYDAQGDHKHAAHLRHRWQVVNEMIRELEKGKAHA